MALHQDELFSSSSRASRARITPADDRGLYVATFAAAASVELMVAGVPVAFDAEINLWIPYEQPSGAATVTITAASTPATADTFDLVINGHVVELTFDDTAAEIQTAIRYVLRDVEPLSQTITVAATTGVDLGDADAVVTITFAEGMGAPSVTLDADDLTGNAHVLGVQEPPGHLDGKNVIRAIVWEESIQIDVSDEVLGVIMVKGEAERDDVNTAAVRALLRGSPSEAELDIALGKPGLRDAGILIRGLSTVH